MLLFSFPKWLNTQIENIPANISSETSGLTCRHVKSGRAHCALLTFSFMSLKVVSILCRKRQTVCPNHCCMRDYSFLWCSQRGGKWTNSVTSIKNSTEEFVKGRNLLEWLLTAQSGKGGVGEAMRGRCITESKLRWPKRKVRLDKASPLPLLL